MNWFKAVFNLKFINCIVKENITPTPFQKITNENYLTFFCCVIDLVTLRIKLPKVDISICLEEAAAGTAKTSNIVGSDRFDVLLENSEGVCNGVDMSIPKGGECGE